VIINCLRWSRIQATLSSCIEDRLTKFVSQQNPTPIARWVASPTHDSCTACIVVVGVAGGTFATISDSTVEPLADSLQGLPDAHAIGKHLTPKPKDRRCERSHSHQKRSPKRKLTIFGNTKKSISDYRQIILEFDSLHLPAV